MYRAKMVKVPSDKGLSVNKGCAAGTMCTVLGS